MYFRLTTYKNTSPKIQMSFHLYFLRIFFALGSTHDSTEGPFKCYVTLEGVGGCMPKRYEALRGGGGGVTSALRDVIFFS